PAPQRTGQDPGGVGAVRLRHVERPVGVPLAKETVHLLQELGVREPLLAVLELVLEEERGPHHGEAGEEDAHQAGLLEEVPPALLTPPSRLALGAEGKREEEAEDDEERDGGEVSAQHGFSYFSAEGAAALRRASFLPLKRSSSSRLSSAVLKRASPGFQ